MKCEKCGTKMLMSEGWVPTYSNPDNFGLDTSAEPYCPKCDGDGEHNPQEDRQAKWCGSAGCPNNPG